MRADIKYICIALFSIITHVQVKITAKTVDGGHSRPPVQDDVQQGVDERVQECDVE